MYRIDIKEAKIFYINKAENINKAEPITIIIENEEEDRSIIYSDSRCFYYYKNIAQTIALYISRDVFDKEGLERKYFGVRTGFDLKFIKRLDGTNITNRDRKLNILLNTNKELLGHEQNKSFQEFFNKLIDDYIFETGI